MAKSLVERIEAAMLQAADEQELTVAWVAIRPLAVAAARAAATPLPARRPLGLPTFRGGS